MSCPFCDEAASVSIVSDFPSLFPVSEGHCLIIPSRHVTNWSDLTVLEEGGMWGRARSVMARFDNADGFNLGVNLGEAAGQTIEHIHIHVIPRRKGDCENPRGGVRHVIPGKGDY